MGWIYKGRFVSAHDVGNPRRPTSIHDDPAYYPIFGTPKKPKETDISSILNNGRDEDPTSKVLEALQAAEEAAERTFYRSIRRSL